MLLFFFFNDTATTEIYTLSLHDALPIWAVREDRRGGGVRGHLGQQPVHQRRARHPRQQRGELDAGPRGRRVDRKSTRLNSSHANISYAVFCLKKKKTNTINPSLHIQISC